MTESDRITLDAALKAQGALRASAGLGAETFPLPDFIGMISDEIEQLRTMGRSDEEIAYIIVANSPVKISAEDIARNYVPPQQRQHRG